MKLLYHANKICAKKNLDLLLSLSYKLMRGD